MGGKASSHSISSHALNLRGDWCGGEFADTEDCNNGRGKELGKIDSSTFARGKNTLFGGRGSLFFDKGPFNGATPSSGAGTDQEY